jgi:hypothetical protein
LRTDADDEYQNDIQFIDVDPTEPTLLGTLPHPIFDTGRTMAQQKSHDVNFVFELTPQNHGLSLDRFAPPFQVDPTLLKVLLPSCPVGTLLGLLNLTNQTNEHTLKPDVDIGQLDTLADEEKLADLIGVDHPTGLEHAQDPVLLPVTLHALDQKPGVDKQRDLLITLSSLSV